MVIPTAIRPRFLRHPSTLALLALVAATTTLSASTPALVDDFTSADKTSCGAPRLIFTDKAMGGNSQAATHVENGVLVVSGELAPGRGAPAFVSLPLLLTADARPQDVQAYTGVRLKVKLERGMLSVQVSSADVTNFDYHLAPVAGRVGEFVEVRVPFKELKRAWSEPTPLNTAVVTSVNLVAVGMAPGSFAFSVDEVGFY